MTFGGHKPPSLVTTTSIIFFDVTIFVRAILLQETKYEVSVKDKLFYHAITLQKAYDNYSFEELRYASPGMP